MRLVDFIIPNNSFHFNLVFPLVKNQKQLAKCGLKVNILNRIPTKKFGDILIITSRFFECIDNNTTTEIIDNLKHYRDLYNKVIYFDTGDSTGSTLFEVLPYVDLYLKQFVLKDLEKYQNAFYQNRIWTDYYYRKNLVEDEQLVDSVLPAKKSELSKIKCGWNYGMGKFYDNRVLEKLSRLFFSRKLLMNYNVRPGIKDNDICLRVSSNYFLKSVSFQRDILMEWGKNNEINVGRVSFSDYWKELKSSKISISPFGWGEICIRDFESIYSGACLLKPSVDHLNTFPNIFKSNLTYVSLDWDLNNLTESIDYALSNDRWLKIARSMSDTHAYYTDSSEGNAEFVNFFKELVL